MKRYISWSGGKDSTASIILCHELGIHVDEIIFCEVMFDHKRGISAEDPEQIKWINEIAIPKIKSFGYDVTIVKSEKDYYYYYYYRHLSDRSKYKGKIYGFPLGKMCWVNNRLKVEPIQKYKKKHLADCEEIIGIAADEPKRLARLTGLKRSILAEQGYTEQMARELCEKYGLLSPIYKSGNRGGCWFCPNQSVDSFRQLRKEHPELWEELLLLDKAEDKSSDGFKYGMTLAQLGYQMDAIDNQTTIFDFLEEEKQ